MANVVYIGVLGFGTVGSGVVKIFQGCKEKIRRETGCDVIVKKILVRNPEKERACAVETAEITTSYEDILYDSAIDIIVEVIGGVDIPRDFILQALQRKKHIVTANKDLLAVCGQELLKVADENQCDFYYEGSVGGGIPVLRGIRDGLPSDNIYKIMGIINGTTNYILTKMTEEGASYEDVLKEAQRLGFAEENPVSDVEGLDPARKAVILSALGFSMNISVEDVATSGISQVTLEDLQFARELGYCMKLIAKMEEQEGALAVSVQPTLLPLSHPLSGVKNENNALYINGETIGEVMFYGQGAGQLPTGTAVVSDILEIVKHIQLGTTGKWNKLATRERKLLSDEEIYGQYLLRVKKKVLEEESIEECLQDEGVKHNRVLRQGDEYIVETESISKQRFFHLKKILREKKFHVISAYSIEGS